MQVVIMVFCTDLDFILTLFCVKVTALAFWRELDLIIHRPLLLVLQQLRYSDPSNPRMNNNCRCNISPFYRVEASNFCLQVYTVQAHLENLSVWTFLYPWLEVQYIYDDFQLLSVWYIDLVAQ